MQPKNPISLQFGQNSEMQNCQDYTDPTVPAAEESKLHEAEIGGNEDNLWIWGYQRQDQHPRKDEKKIVVQKYYR